MRLLRHRRLPLSYRRGGFPYGDLFRLVCLACALACWFPAAMAQSPTQTPAPPTPSEGPEQAPAMPAAAQRLEQRLQRTFRKQIFPLLTHSEKGCVDCHREPGTSALVLSGEVLGDFHTLLDQQYLRAAGADTLLHRVTTGHVERRMPKDAPAWDNAEIEKLKRFLQSVKQLEDQTGIAADERFPRALLAGYTGPEIETTDNQFITFRQLKGKIQTQFEDDWVRDGRDLFAENVAMFGGADFKTRFDESSQPSASFLTALETMARDVAAVAYQRRRGPFENWPQPASRPQAGQIDQEYRQAIEALFERILYRPPSADELQQSFNMLCDIYQLESTIAQRSHQLVFKLTVGDPASGLEQSQLVRIPVEGDPLEVHQLLIDQTIDASQSPDTAEPSPAPTTDASARKSQRHLSHRVLTEDMWLEPGVTGQRLVLHNVGTLRNVSFAGLDIVAADSGQVVQSIAANSNQIELDGAWQVADDEGYESLEDRNQHKGLSLLRVPLRVERAGAYKLVLYWRANPRNATNVLVELFGARAGNRLASPALATVPPVGQAQFFYDCSEDAQAFFAPPATFLFDAESRVRISNEKTLDQVTAGAIEFTQVDGSGGEFVIDSLDADSDKRWSRFDEGRFKAYNVKGAKLHDDNQRKGELELNYRLASKAESGWQADRFYSLRVYYPGKRDQECQVPLTIFASKSSPIIAVSHPRVAKADAPVRIDATSSYTVSHAPLRFHWQQLGGSRVAIADPQSPVLEFVAPRRSAQEAAWVALCAALVRHPDFLFTRPPSLFECVDPAVKARLQLVKLALDLVGRSPSRTELEMLAAGRSLSELADGYLASDEFRQFYFHRVRLYLESQGTEVQDEPVRLWCHIAFEGRPLQEILTADYTADAAFQRQPRPDFHGKTGVLTTRGFIQGKPGLPHYNYAAQVSMLFLGFVYEVPPEIVELREGVTALGTTDPNSVCYSCHKILTPLAFQRSNWTDDGDFKLKDEYERLIDASDRGASADYPFAGVGLEAFATQAVKKERFLRTMINTHVNFYFGRPLRYLQDERVLYRRLWDSLHESSFKIPDLIRAIVTSPEYLEGRSISPAPHAVTNNKRAS